MKLPVALMDVFFLLLSLFLTLAAALFFFINPSNEEIPSAKVVPEFRMTVSWATEDNSDVDSWACRKGDPDSLTGFSRREKDVFILKNDNTSSMYGRVGDQELEEAREELTIETIKADTYFFSIHGYAIRNSKSRVKVRVEIDKTNPYKHILTKEVYIINMEEVPICTFDIDFKGNVVKGSLLVDPDLLTKILVGGIANNGYGEE